jgi:predicted phage terminase large subunit-like protein
MNLTPAIIEAFAGAYLSPRYDQVQPTPPFHRECWARYCSDHPACATAAPRNHAKSTGLTHDYILATVLFRVEPYVILVGATEEMAIEHLGDITSEIRENDDLNRDFKIKGFITEQRTDIIVECIDGYQFRIIARGAEQKIRGRKWNGRRPGLIVFDDIEDDEQVESRERRQKFRRWFFRACKQALRDGGKIRGHGTILHEDSLLSSLMKNKEWDSRLYKAHAGFDDFSNILWPEKFPESRLRRIRQELINAGDAAGYSQEYLNDPFDRSDAYLVRPDFIPMKDAEHEIYMQICAGVDFAITKHDYGNRTSISVGGKAVDNLLFFRDQRVGRWDSLEIIEQLFSVQSRWNPEMFFVESGAIWNSLWPVIRQEMQRRDILMNFQSIPPMKDKAARGRSLQKRMRAGLCRFDKSAEWYPGFEAELLMFSGESDARLDDQFDSAAILSAGFETLSDIEKDDYLSDEDLEFEAMAMAARKTSGRSLVTGY